MQIRSPRLLRSTTAAFVATIAFAPVAPRGASLAAQDTTRPRLAAPGSDSLRRVPAARDSIRRDSIRRDSIKRDSVKKESLWPVKGPTPLPGSILPERRIVAFYGNPLSTRMGILGELKPDQMLARLDREVEAWRKADPETPVQPALHLIAVVAQAGPGRDGKYRLRMTDSLIERVASWAAQRNALLFLDIQVGKSTLQQEVPRLAHFLKRPNVHLGIDPEFSMKTGHKPGTRIGRYDAADINWATGYLADLVTAEKLPPKILVVHRFTRPMVTNYRKIRLDPRVQIVMHMDGWGTPTRKKDSYQAYIYKEPVQFTGFKIFYKNDRKRGSTLMTPADLLKLTPVPLYIQYQ